MTNSLLRKTWEKHENGNFLMQQAMITDDLHSVTKSQSTISILLISDAKLVKNGNFLIQHLQQKQSQFPFSKSLIPSALHRYHVSFLLNLSRTLPFLKSPTTLSLLSDCFCFKASLTCSRLCSSITPFFLCTSFFPLERPFFLYLGSYSIFNGLRNCKEGENCQTILKGHPLLTKSYLFWTVLNINLKYTQQNNFTRFKEGTSLLFRQQSINKLWYVF